MYKEPQNPPHIHNGQRRPRAGNPRAPQLPADGINHNIEDVYSMGR